MGVGEWLWAGTYLFLRPQDQTFPHFLQTGIWHHDELQVFGALGVDLPCRLCTPPDLLRTLEDGVYSSEKSYASLAHALARTLGRIPVGTGTDAMGLALARPTLGSLRPPSVFSGEDVRGMGQGYRLPQGARWGDQTLRI